VSGYDVFGANYRGVSLQQRGREGEIISGGWDKRKKTSIKVAKSYTERAPRLRRAPESSFVALPVSVRSDSGPKR